uniref:Uncharacterized protein n=1 Tax=Tanacetum cinerariifolium TaxID=118510 RepID=A0A6L2J7B0_TANCI|nr:hypothetical protein [Tanacetum cinerariifolium]
MQLDHEREEMMIQQVLNPVVEMMLVVVEEQLVLDMMVNGQLVGDNSSNEPFVLYMIAVIEEVNSIVEQLVKAVDDTDIDCCSMEESVGAALIASLAGVLKLYTHSSSETDPSESSPPPVFVAPMVLPFLCSDDSELDTERPERHVSPHDAMLTRWRSKRAILIQPEEDIFIGRLYRTHPGGLCRALTMWKSARPLSSHRLALRSFLIRTCINRHYRCCFIRTLEICLSTLARTPWCSKAYLRWRSPADTVTSSIHATRALVPSRADLLPPRKRFRDSILLEDSVEEDINTDVLEDIEADVTTVEVAVDRDVEPGVDAYIGMEVDVRIDVEDEVKDDVESNDRGTIEVRVDLVVGIDIPDEIRLQRIKDIETRQRELEARNLIAGGERSSLLESVASLKRTNARLRGTMMMERNMTITRSSMTPEAIKELVDRRVEEASAAYEATRDVNALEAESQSQNGSDSDNGNGRNGNGKNRNGRNGNGKNRNGRNGNGGNENLNENDRGARPAAR